jgi:hypothetical protein
MVTFLGAPVSGAVDIDYIILPFMCVRVTREKKEQRCGGVKVIISVAYVGAF